MSAAIPILTPPSAGRDPGSLYCGGGSPPCEGVSRTLLDALPDCVQVLDLDGRLEYISAAGLRVLGVAEQRVVLGRPLTELLPDAARPAGEAALVTARAGGTARFQLPLSVPGRGPAWFDVTVSSVRDAGGSIVRLVAVGRDITEIKRAEDRLREREALVRGAFDDAPIGMAIVALDGRWIRANQALCAILGYAEDELLESTFLALTHPDDRALAVELNRQLLAGKRTRYQYEKRYLHRGGRPVWVSVMVALLRDASGNPRMQLAQVQDITERVRTEEALRQSESLLRSTQEAAGIGSWAWDGATRVLSWSDELFRICGMAAAEAPVTFDRFLSLIHPEDRARALQTICEAEATGGAYRFDHRVVKPDGSVRWMHTRGQVVKDAFGDVRRALGTSQDITDQLRAEEEQRRQAEMLKAIFDHIPAMIIFADRDGQPMLANREWERVTGWDIDSAFGTGRVDQVVPDPADRERVRILMRDSSGGWGDVRLRTRDGRTLDTAWACVTLSDGSVVSIGQDVTERRRLEEQLQQSQKMEAVGQLAGGVAHDFNNLLTVIQSYGQFVAGDLPPDSPARADLAEVLKAADRAADLTRQLLAFSRKQILQPRLLDVNQVVSSVAAMLRRVIGEDVRLETVLAPDLEMVRADRSQLEQVLMNLAVNARDAMPHGGALVLRTANVTVDGSRSAAHPELSPGTYMAIEVEDSGSGIAPEHLQRIFEPFFTTKAPGKGTGLGLATVYGIVTQSGGHITVDSTRGRGTRFTVLLPHRHAEPPAAMAVDAASTPRGKETILVVEDEAPVRAAVRRMLEQFGYTVREAAGGAAALACLVRGDAIDLVLTDVVMPEIHGQALVSRARRCTPALRVLYMSGYSDDERLQQGVLEPGIALLRKPFTAEALAAAVRGILDEPPAVA